MNKICLHIGFHKTATTFFQKNIFMRHSDIKYWGKPWKSSISDNLFYYIFNNKKKILFEENINKLLNLNNKKLNLFSEERLSSNYYYQNKDIESGMKRIKKIFKKNNSKLKILVLVRNQVDLIISRYAENNNLFKEVNPSWSSFACFKRDLNNKKLTKKEIILLDNFKYYKFIKILEKYFGRENIGVFKYEDLVINQNQILKKIFSFLNVSPKTAKNSKIYKSLKFFKFYESKNNKFYQSRSIYLYESKKFENFPKILILIIDKFFFTFLSFFNYILQTITNPIWKNENYINSVKNYYKQDNLKLTKYISKKKYNKFLLNKTNFY